MKDNYDVIICGSGIAGVSAAYHLSVNHDIQNILLVDNRHPLSLTSASSTECYRNWWSGPDNAMVEFMNRSIDLMEGLAKKSGDIFQMNRRGYLFVTANEANITDFIDWAEQPAKMIAGPIRSYTPDTADQAYRLKSTNFLDDPDYGADLILDPSLIQKHFPYISDKAIAALHVRRAGWISAQQLGMYLLDQARSHGAELVKAKITDVHTKKGQVSCVELNNNKLVETHNFVNAAGPFLKDVGNLAGIDLPVFCELHMKVIYKDYLHLIPRDAPLMIWKDDQFLPWNKEERAILDSEDNSKQLTNLFPPGVHTRPEGGKDSNHFIILWEYTPSKTQPIFPPKLDPKYPEIALRGISTMLPCMQMYFNKTPLPILDGGYYTKTIENRPIIGPTSVKGVYIIGALSGFGIMGACAAGELLAAHVADADLPKYAPSFLLTRYQDQQYQQKIKSWSNTDQL